MSERRGPPPPLPVGRYKEKSCVVVQQRVKCNDMICLVATPDALGLYCLMGRLFKISYFLNIAQP